MLSVSVSWNATRLLQVLKIATFLVWEEEAITVKEGENGESNIALRDCIENAQMKKQKENVEHEKWYL